MWAVAWPRGSRPVCGGASQPPGQAASPAETWVWAQVTSFIHLLTWSFIHLFTHSLILWLTDTSQVPGPLQVLDTRGESPA